MRIAALLSSQISYEPRGMSFSHLEKSLILLRDRGQWSRDVAVAVQARYDRHDRSTQFISSRTSSISTRCCSFCMRSALVNPSHSGGSPHNFLITST
jgi:hypothetical protein